jgi:hypothetical protein
MTLEIKPTNQRVPSSRANDAKIATLVPRCAMIESRKRNLDRIKSEEDNRRYLISRCEVVNLWTLEI